MLKSMLLFLFVFFQKKKIFIFAPTLPKIFRPFTRNTHINFYLASLSDVVSEGLRKLTDADYKT